MAINPQARNYVIEQMSQTPELRGIISQMASRSPNAARMSREFAQVNPNNYNRYNPELGKITHQADSGGWNWWNDPSSKSAVTASEAYNDLMSQDKIAGTKHFDAAGNRMLATSRLKDVGVTDMDQVGVVAGPDGNAIFYDKVTGKELPNVLKGWKDKGQTSFYFNIDPNGGVYLDEHFQKDKRRSGLGKIAPGFTNPIVSTALAVGAGFLAPGLAGAMGGGLTGSAAAGATLGAGHAAITGGKIGKSALVGAFGGGLGNYASGTKFVQGMSSPALRGATIGAITGAGTGALGAGLYGGNVGKGLLSGALAGGAGGYGAGALGGDPNTLMGRLTASGGRALGTRAGQQIAGNLIGSPFDRRAAQQPRGALQQVQPQYPDLSFLPPHAQERIRGLIG